MEQEIIIMGAQNLAKVEIKAKDLELIVSEKTLGKLVTNALQIKELVENALPNYDIANYDESNIDKAKKDKALLNNAAKMLNSKRIEFEKEFMKPFGEFKGIVADTVKLISECSNKIDTVVKLSDEKAREQKRELIKKYFAGKEFTLVGLSKIFDEKWLNKTTSLKSIYTDIDTKIATISNDIQALDDIGEDADVLKALYLDTLNISTTLQYGKTLRENRVKAQREAEERAKTKAESEVMLFNNAEVAGQQVAPNQQKVEPQKAINTQQPIATIYERAFKVRTTREKIIALADFMNNNNIDFQKIEL